MVLRNPLVGETKVRGGSFFLMKICGAVLPHNLVFLGHRERCIHMSLPYLDSQMVTSLFSFFLIKTREAILPHRPSYPLAQREDLVFSRHR
jgi:hypothetical protein